MSDANPTDEGLLKRLWSAIDPKGTLSARIMLRIYRILRWAAFLVFISFISTTGWLIYTRSEARDQVETLRLENAADEAQRKSDIAAMNSTIAAHQQHQVDLRKSNVELLQANHTLKGALRRKIAVQPPRPANPRLKADLKQSLERNMILQKRLEKLSAAPRAADNAKLRAEADAAYRALGESTDQRTELIRKVGKLRNALQMQKRLMGDIRLEMEMLKAREGVEQWGQEVSVSIAYYRCKAQSRDKVVLRRISRRQGASLSIDLFPGEGDRRGLFITNTRYRLPAGLYDIEIWKNGKQISISPYPRYLSPNPRLQYIVCPDGRRLLIRGQGNVNLILLSTKSYRLSTLPSSP